MFKENRVILIAEDDHNDAFLLERTIRKIGATAPIQIVENGEEAIHYLAGEGKYADRAAYPFPAVLITDIKMPRRNGFELLDWIRDHPECATIPTIVWSSSNLESDVIKAYQLGANCYLRKPTNLNDWQERLTLLF